MNLVVVAPTFGGPEVLSVVEQPTGVPGPGQALVEVRAAGVNPSDWKAASGAFGADPARLPLRLGYEAAGVVTAGGPDARGPARTLAAGDEGVGWRPEGGDRSALGGPAGGVGPQAAR